MKAGESFQAILEALIKKETGGAPAPSSPQPQSPLSQQVKAESIIGRLFFGEGLSKTKVFSSTQKYQTPPKKEEPKIEVKVEVKAEPPRAKPEPQPAPRVKRQLNFDQKAALNIFVKFGAKSVDDYSTDEELKSAYRRLARRYHPDTGARNDDAFKIISAAYKKLID